MSIVGLIIVVLIFVILLLTYPLACWVSGDNEVIDKCEELKKWAEIELKEREANRMICKNCIHYEICCNEGRDDEALTFCADFFDLVRCKDCKYSESVPKWKDFELGCMLHREYTTATDFCSQAEREESE